MMSGRQNTAAAARAFTLVEMVTVLALFAIFMGIIATAARPLLSSTRLDASANKLQAALRQARGEAIALGLPVSVTFNNSSMLETPAKDLPLQIGGQGVPSWTNRLDDWDSYTNDNDWRGFGYDKGTNRDTLAPSWAADDYDAYLMLDGNPHVRLSSSGKAPDPTQLPQVPDLRLAPNVAGRAATNNVAPWARPNQDARGRFQFYYVVKHLPRGDGSINTWDVFQLPAPVNDPRLMYDDPAVPPPTGPSDNAAKRFTYERSFLPSVIGGKRLLEENTMFMSFGGVRLYADNSGSYTLNATKKYPNGALVYENGSLYRVVTDNDAGEVVTIGSAISEDYQFGVVSGNATRGVSNWNALDKADNGLFYPSFFWGRFNGSKVDVLPPTGPQIIGRGANAYLGTARVTFMPDGRAVSYANNVKCIRPSEVPDAQPHGEPEEFLLTPKGWYIIGLCNMPKTNGQAGELTAPLEFWDERVGVGVHDTTGRVLVQREWNTNEY